MISCPFAKAMRASNSFGVPPQIVVYCFSLRNRCKADLQRVHSHPTRIPGSAYALLIPARLIPSSYASTMAGNLSLGSYSSRRSGSSYKPVGEMNNLQVSTHSHAACSTTFRFQHIHTLLAQHRKLGSLTHLITEQQKFMLATTLHHSLLLCPIR